MEDIVIKDWGEPECWCCGHFVQKVYKHNTYNTDLQTEKGIKKIWNYKEVQSTFNRCHIYPKALGGSFHPSNLFLLCEDCHQLSPDTTNPKIFFSWILKHKEVAMRDLNGWNEKEKEEAIQELDNMCDNFSIDKIELMKYIHNNKKELDTFLSSNVNTHGNEIVLSSLIG